MSETKTANEARMIKQVATDSNLPLHKVQAAIALLDEGNTIPFIARYRKEMTGELDENELRTIEEKLNYIRQLETRKGEVIRLIAEQGKLTDELSQAISVATKLQEVEDLYRPYRQKRKTRASVAKERGLEPLAAWLLAQQGHNVAEVASRYLNDELGVDSVEMALQGAQDIIAEQLADDAAIRAWIRRFTLEQAMLQTTAKNADAESVYEMYYNYQEPLKKLPPHRTLAINRGEREDVLKVNVVVPQEPIVNYMIQLTVLKNAPAAVRQLLEATIEDAYKRLIAPSIEREVRTQWTEKAEEHAIQIFSANLRNLLLSPPVSGHVVLGVDPAYRTGCKLAVVDDTGKLLEVAVTYPTPPNNKVVEAANKINSLIDRYNVELIVIGNGTASRETEQFIANLITERKQQQKQPTLKYIIVSEAGASVYSASKLAAEEFPALDVAERSAVSIARRLQDPLAELVKIEPKAIGVGQYQHDVSQKRLEESLGGVVESAVNHVGVDVNTASPSLLSYVAGINATTAKNIVKYRDENGKFVNRTGLKKVPRLGAKTYEQCIGFIRIADSTNPLDSTPIHPESYAVVDALCRQRALKLTELNTDQFKSELQALDVPLTATQLGVGEPTLRDIIDSLLRPGRDPRDQLPPPIFSTDVLAIEDLKPGMELQGTVRNVIDFGAFVDIGIKNDGLVHISQLSNKFVKHPLDVVAVGDQVTVWVMSVDLKKGRVSLTMKKPSGSLG